MDDMRGPGEYEMDEWAEDLAYMKLSNDIWLQYQRFAEEEIEGIVFSGGYLVYPLGIERAKRI